MREQRVAFREAAAAGPVAHYARVDAYRAGADDAGICGIVRQNAFRWLDDLARCHAGVGRRVAAAAPEWWYSRLSRLDARPWGNAGVIKPLFFARAILAWLDRNPDARGLTVVGAPSEVGGYLRSAARPGLDVDCEDPANPSGPAGIARTIARLLRSHAFRPRPVLQHPTLVLFQRPQDASGADAFRFYFNGLLEEQPGVGGAVLGIQPYSGDRDGLPCVLDGVRLSDAVSAVFASRRLRLAVDRACETSECTIDGVSFHGFWQAYANGLFDAGEIVDAVCTRKSLERIEAPAVRRMIYPYEEKAIERALADAALKRGWRTVGFAPHPQHRLNIAMQDRSDLTWPKPAAYAYCGAGYESFFKDWGRKPNAAAEVWGSTKGWRADVDPEFDCAGRRLRVLFLVSHPVEIAMLGAWLEATPGLKEAAEFQIRPYKATGLAVSAGPLASFFRAHPGIEEAGGTLEENLAGCDVVLFCATSAGPEAVNRGRLAIFADLNDVFPINPMFDDVDAMLPAADANALLDRFKLLSAMTPDGHRDLHRRQKEAAGRCFAPVDRAAISRSLS